MRDDNRDNEPISNQEFKREMDKLANRVRKEHLLVVFSKELPGCLFCKNHILNSEEYCTYCGKYNKNYDEAQFELENNATVTEIRTQEGCPDTHAALREALKDEDLKERKGKIHCAQCGVLVDIN